MTERSEEMGRRVEGKQALVTGGAKGLGEAIGWMLAREGARVVLSDIDLPRARAVADAINSVLGPASATAVHHDVADPLSWERCLSEAEAFLGGLSVLVNNAGVAPVGSIDDMSLDEWDRAMRVNVDSVMLGSRKALPLLQRAQPASIVNIASISALIASGNLAAYNASKAAVWMLTKSVALHCARQRWDIRCNSVHPAFVQTDILRTFVKEGGNEDETFTKLSRQVPLGRLGTPDDVAYAVLYLASDESRFMTGAEIKIDGGISAQ